MFYYKAHGLVESCGACSCRNPGWLMRKFSWALELETNHQVALVGIRTYNYILRVEMGFPLSTYLPLSHTFLFCAHRHTHKHSRLYFNDLSTWFKVHGTSTMRACPNQLFEFNSRKNRVAAAGSRFKMVALSLLIYQRHVLDTACNIPISVSSPIPFESQVSLHHGRLLFMMAIRQLRFLQ